MLNENANRDDFIKTASESLKANGMPDTIGCVASWQIGFIEGLTYMHDNIMGAVEAKVFASRMEKLMSEEQPDA